MIGLVYKICHKDVNICNQIYIGSTSYKLDQRFYKHINGFKNRLKQNNYITSFDLFNKYDINDLKIELIKQYDVVDLKQLKVYEALAIYKYKHIVVNKYPAYAIKRFTKSSYYKLNKEHFSLKNKSYYQQNKERIIQNVKDRLNKLKIQNIT